MSLWNKIKKWSVIESEERLSWALMSYILGILLCGYVQIPVFLLLGIMMGSGIVIFMVRRKEWQSLFGIMTLCFFFGLGNMQWQVNLMRHPILDHPLYQTQIKAIVEENQLLQGKQILTLKNIYWPNPDLKMPQKIKVHFQAVEPVLKTGDKVKAFISVYPPDKTFSTAYSYQLWFNKIGATGIATKIELISSDPKVQILFNVRTFINQHLFQILPNSQAEIAAPLITGEQKLVSKETYQIYRRAGIAHVLSVSGFHMALLAGFLFFVIRGFFVLFPRIVFFYNTKKIAAVAAWIGTFLYLGVSGFQVPAIRAFMMISLVFLGMLIERRVLSMRSLLLVGFCLLLIMPQMLFSISFQLSFVAVAVLVFICQYLEHQSWNKSIKTIVGFLMLNIFVSLALMPFILYHFHQLMPYGIK